MITIVGAGALGSHVALFLRNVDSLSVIDFDKVEQKNIQSQFHSKMGLRKNKVSALQQAMQGMFGVGIKSFPHKLTDDNAEQLLKSAEIVIDCTDNIAAREVIKNWTCGLDIPCLHCCLSAGGDFARIIWSEDFVPDAEGVEGEATCEDGEQLPFFATAAGLIAQEIQRFVETGKKQSFQLSPAGMLRLT